MLKAALHPRKEFAGKYCVVDVGPDKKIQGYYVGRINKYLALHDMTSYSCPHIYTNKTLALAFIESLKHSANDS